MISISIGVGEFFYPPSYPKSQKKSPNKVIKKQKNTSATARKLHSAFAMKKRVVGNTSFDALISERMGLTIYYRKGDSEPSPVLEK